MHIRKASCWMSDSYTDYLCVRSAFKMEQISNILPTQSSGKGMIWIANLEVIQTSWNTLRAFWSNLISVCLGNVFLFYIWKIPSTRTTFHPDKSYWHFLVSHYHLLQRLLFSFKYWKALCGNNFKSTKTSTKTSG